MSIVGSEQWMYASGEEVTQQSLKFNDDESQYLSWTPASAGNRKTWTWSGWVKRGNMGVERGIFSVGATSANFALFFHTSDQLRVWISGGNASIYTNAVYRDPSAWYHIVLQSSNVSPYIKLYVNGEEITSFSYDGRATYPSTNDTEVNSVDVHRIGGWYNGGLQTFDGYMSNIHFIDGQALDPTSFGQFTNGYWEKKDYAGSYGTNGFHLTFADDVVSEGFNAVTYRGNGGTQSISGLGFEPDLVWVKDRDTTGLGNIIFDSVRGVSKFLFSSDTSAEGSSSGILNSFDADGFSIGSNGHVNNNNTRIVAWAWDAGENNAPTGHSSVTYTGNGGTQSIKGFGFEPDLVWIKARNNGSAWHSLTDSVRGVTKFLYSNGSSAEATSSVPFKSFDSDGFTVGSDTSTSRTNVSGESYVGWAWDAGSGSPVSNTDGSITSTVKANPATGFSIVSYTGTGSNASVGHGLGVQPSMIIAKRRDTADNWPVYHTSTGSSQYAYLDVTNGFSGATSVWQGVDPTSSVFSIGSSLTVNSSGGTYIAYCFAEVAGYSSIGSYTGTGASGNAINCGFRPGFVMVKRTDTSGTHWIMADSTRNPVNPIDKKLAANLSDAENSGAIGNSSQNNFEFTGTGFELSTGIGDTNANGGTYIYMAFKGSYSDYVSDYNTDGTIDSRVKANPAQGFSITSYTGNGTAGATVGHGLSSAPDMVIVKIRSGFSGGTNWRVYHSALGAQYNLRLNDTAAAVSETNKWNDTAPTSSVFSLGNHVSVNENNATAIAYCFNSVAGYSKISSYTGTGAAGNAVTGLGFKPAFLMVKRTDSASSWRIYDNTRDTTNPRNILLFPSDSGAEATSSTYDINFDADGFTLNGTNASSNASGGSYLYYAVADTREAAFWKDVSGQGNHWTPNNLDYRDSLVDSPANNFATLNAVDKAGSGVLAEGNLKYDTSTSTYDPIRATVSVSSGKWYWEIYCASQSGASANTFIAGIVKDTSNIFAASYFIGSDAGSYSMYFGNGYKYNNGSGSAYGSSSTTGDIVSIALDLDAGTLTFYKNGVSQGVAYSGLSGTFAPAYSDVGTSGATSVVLNFGQDSTFSGAKPMGAYTDDNDIGNFQYAPPAGYLALCSQNLPTPTIVDGSEHFNTVLYTGTGATQSITGVGFGSAPDFVWIKDRTTAYDYHLFDVVRGSGNSLYSNDTVAENTYATDITFDADGFTIADGSTTPQIYINRNTDAFASWNWKAGGAAVSNTAGSITSQVSANVDAGFSIVSYVGNATTNATIGHGLGVAPDFIIHKNRSVTDDWSVWSSALPNTTGYKLLLNSTSAQQTTSNYPTLPTSSVFYVGAGQEVNGSGSNMIAYCFANSDIIKAGSYVGNGSTDGPFVFTGFRPAWVMFKCSSLSSQWIIYDAVRDTFNGVDSWLNPNRTNAEGTDSIYDVDFVSNGFKIRNTDVAWNSNSATYIYLAFAEHPFKYSNAR